MVSGRNPSASAASPRANANEPAPCPTSNRTPPRPRLERRGDDAHVTIEDARLPGGEGVGHDVAAAELRQDVLDGRV